MDEPSVLNPFYVIACKERITHEQGHSMVFSQQQCNRL